MVDKTKILYLDTVFTKELSEDDVKAVEKEFDKLMADYQASIDEKLKAKEAEVMTV